MVACQVTFGQLFPLCSQKVMSRPRVVFYFIIFSVRQIKFKLNTFLGSLFYNLVTMEEKKNS